MSHDALIEQLFRKIPPAGATWPIADRHRWLRATEGVLDLLYGDNQVIEIGPLPPRAETAETAEVEKPSQQQAETPAAPIEEKPAEPEPPASPPEPEQPKTGGRSKNRPEGIPSNLNMALDAIDELGPASAQQILTWCRRKYWEDMPGTWTAVLWNFAAEGKLGRVGRDLCRPRSVTVQGGGAIVKVGPAPAAKPVAPVRFIPAPEDTAMPFEHKGQKLTLHKKEWRLATALVRAMGKGHLDYGFLVNAATAGERRPPIGDKPWLAEMFGILTPKLQTIGLDVVHSDNFGYSMREVEPANG